MKKLSLFTMLLAFAVAINLSSCSKDDDSNDNGNGGGGNGDIENELKGEVTGTLTKGEYFVTADIIVPAGQTLTLEPGVILSFVGDGLSPESSPEIKLDGNLKAVGTASDPIMFTLREEERTVDNAYEGKWGGIQASSTTDYLIMQHCIVEFTGGPADGNRPDIYDAGEPRYAIHFGNPSGTMIFDKCTLRHIADDGIRPQGGGRFAFTNSVFYNIGETGGEGINFKDGSVGDVCYNLFYGVATNGSKPAGGGDGVPQTNINNYNNTFVNCGFRRVQAGRGGSINYEQGARGLNHNNIIVNCRFGIRFRADRLPDMDNIGYSHTLYYASDETDRDNFFPSTDVDANNNRLSEEQEGDILNQDPKFVNYSVSTSKLNADLNPSWNFTLSSDSPGKGTGKTDFSPVFSTLSAGGFTLTIPQPSADFGAFGAQ